MRLIDADRLKEVFSRNVVGGNAYFDLIDNAPTVNADMVDACHLTINALEQEPIIDKIRAEIEAKYGQCSICEFDLINGEYTDIGDIADILQIIDKYKAESEVV